MKRKKLTEEYEYSGSDEEAGSLDPPTIKKQGNQGVNGRSCTSPTPLFVCPLIGMCLVIPSPNVTVFEKIDWVARN